MPGERPFLPYCRHFIEDDDIEAVTDVLRGEFLTTGPVVDAFENKLAEVTGARHVVSCSSGTAALHLTASALDLGPGDWAIVPAMTFLATANAARYVGADVIFADVDAETGLMTSETFEAARATAMGSVKAVYPVHINGQTANMAAIRQVAGDMPIVEDACHALGGVHKAANGEWVPVGSCAYSEMSIFSFHPVKTVAMGEGGAVTTNDDHLAERLRRHRNIGMNRNPETIENAGQAFDTSGEINPWYYEMPELGLNYRASAVHCALGLNQLGKLERFVGIRNRLVERYAEALAPLAAVVRMLPKSADCEAAWHLCVVLIDFDAAGTDRAQVMKALAARNIGTQVHYLPVNRQPYYQRLYGETTLPGADAYYEKILSLPLQVSMTDEDVEYVAAMLGEVLGGGG
ncbi:MAG: UDP-4-amino-4,6-dideoxy-N-acetyl-beta-L-altrosamine transaminase [Rhodospirillaceae bacterium]|nr:UDP-4-amino-4,6-dideoxy-N-acetyl-beta-L-altrosamine transaminase [Rhodospirillaceae bacterium]